MTTDIQLPASLDATLVATVTAGLKGKRLEHFLVSVAAINDSLAAGGWVGKACQQSTKGFGQGIPHPAGGRGGSDSRSPTYPAYTAIAYGSGSKTWAQMQADGATDAQLQALSPKQPLALIVAWVDLCCEASTARCMLDLLRPLPKVTAIGLSPKVTATLTDMGMDLDLASIKPTKIGTRWSQGRYPQTVTKERYDRDSRRYVKFTEPHPKAGELMFDRAGEPVMLPRYFLDWTEGTNMRCSRYSHRDCEACGKVIPSGRFVAIEADCRINGHVGLYLGCDCAKNIFGVKDVGVAKP